MADPYWKQHGHSYRSIGDYVEAIVNATSAHGRWASVFLMTDSEKAVAEFTDALHQAVNATVMLDKLENRTVIEASGGHVNVPEEMKHELQLQFVSTVSVVRRIAEFAVGNLSSNVFRVLLQLIGAEQRCAQTRRTGGLAYSFDTSEASEGWGG